MSFSVVFPEKSFRGVRAILDRTLVFRQRQLILAATPDVAIEVFAQGKPKAMKRAFCLLTFEWPIMRLLVLAITCD
jgi:hypothetical protein